MNTHSNCINLHDSYVIFVQNTRMRMQQIFDR